MMNLAPPGIDEVMAIAEVADGTRGSGGTRHDDCDDTAPTGHVLRLLQTPALLREWTHALMAILLKYREIVTPGSLGALLLELSKRLRGLDTLLHDGRQATFVLVTRPALLPRQETVRLSSTLARLGIAVGGVIVNAVGGGDCSLCRSRIRGQANEVRLLRRALGTRASYAIIEAPAVHAASAWRPCPGGVGLHLETGRVMSSATSAVYVYCLVAAARRPSRARLAPGLPGGTPPVVTAAGEGLFIVSSDVPLTVFGPPHLEERLRDLDWVSDLPSRTRRRSSGSLECRRRPSCR